MYWSTTSRCLNWQQPTGARTERQSGSAMHSGEGVALGNDPSIG